MARLYADENFPLKVVLALRASGHEVLTALEAGNANRRVPDEAVLAFAIETGRAVLTMNRRDFIRLHRDVPDHTGIVVCTSDPDFPALAARVEGALRAAGEVLGGQLLRVSRPAAGQVTPSRPDPVPDTRK